LPIDATRAVFGQRRLATAGVFVVFLLPKPASDFVEVIERRLLPVKPCLFGDRNRFVDIPGDFFRRHSPGNVLDSIEARPVKRAKRAFNCPASVRVFDMLPGEVQREQRRRPFVFVERHVESALRRSVFCHVPRLSSSRLSRASICYMPLDLQTLNLSRRPACGRRPRREAAPAVAPVRRVAVEAVEPSRRRSRHALRRAFYAISCQFVKKTFGKIGRASRSGKPVVPSPPRPGFAPSGGSVGVAAFPSTDLEDDLRFDVAPRVRPGSPPCERSALAPCKPSRCAVHCAV